MGWKLWFSFQEKMETGPRRQRLGGDIWRIIPGIVSSKQLGSPLFVSQKVRPFRRGNHPKELGGLTNSLCFFFHHVSVRYGMLLFERFGVQAVRSQRQAGRAREGRGGIGRGLGVKLLEF